jgi:outer membrane biosynthesis protein TonB
VKVVKTSGTAMTTEALAAVRQWKYMPATRNGVAIPYPISIAFTMTMRSQ